ncbi:hypothetical protein ACHAW5_000337 [Stephanodiscus triporus]|uniref:Uncharacterized protein n=1 Tax=Stephanodiscus triporus TaxID=2934178 RepID=A0ABD3NMM6_9STRA
MTKKSPIKNLVAVAASRTTQLYDSASAAVQQGAQLSSVVASKAKRHAQQHHGMMTTTTTTTTPSPRRGRDDDSGSGPKGGVRDRINLFDSASRGDGRKLTRDSQATSLAAYSSFRQSPYRKHALGRMAARRDREEAGQRVERRQREARDDDHDDDIPLHISHGHRPTTDHLCHEKENEVNKIERKHAAAAVASVSKDRKDPSSTSPPPHVVIRRSDREMVGVATNSEQPRRMPKERDEVITRDDRLADDVGNETHQRNDGGSHRHWKRNGTEGESAKDGKDEHGGRTTKTKCGGGRHHRDENAVNTTTEEMPASASDNENVPRLTTTTTRTTGGDNAKKRYSPSNRYKHALIQSPLRKHMKAVHDSACSNATCTITKEPFPLLLPSSGGVPPPSSRPNHLVLLGAVTGAAASPKSDGDGNVGKDEEEEAAEERGDEAATDLLTSAAFLFKNSRRNLF